MSAQSAKRMESSSVQGVEIVAEEREMALLNHPGFGRDSLLGSGDQADQVAQFVQSLELDRWFASAGSVQSMVAYINPPMQR